MAKQNMWERFTDWLSVASTIVDFWNIFTYILAVASGGGTVATALNNLPAYIPITLGAISFASLIFAIIRTIVRYKRWARTINDPTVQDILKTLLDMHLLLGKLTANLQGLRVVNSQIVASALAFHKLVGIDMEIYKNLKQQPYEAAFQSIYKRTKKAYGFDLNDIITLTDAFADVGRQMDKNHFGISKCFNNPQYQLWHTQLMGDELRLNLSDAKKVYSIDQVKELSFGLHSLSLLWIFLKREPSFIKIVPDEHIKLFEKTIANANSLYTVALLQLKQIIMDDLVRSRL